MFRCHVGQAEAARRHLQTYTRRWCEATLDACSWVGAGVRVARQGSGVGEAERGHAMKGILAEHWGRSGARAQQGQIGRMAFGGCPQPSLSLPRGMDAGWCGMRDTMSSATQAQGETHERQSQHGPFSKGTARDRLQERTFCSVFPLDRGFVCFSGFVSASFLLPKGTAR